jgi:excisionase family DNA binding protein
MVKEGKLSIAILCLSVSLIVSAVIISNGMKANGEYVRVGLGSVSQGNEIYVHMQDGENTASTVHKRNTYEFGTAASYLGISDESLTNLINSEQSGIPYIKIGSSYTFSKAALDKWLETARVQID